MFAVVASLAILLGFNMQIMYDPFVSLLYNGTIDRISAEELNKEVQEEMIIVDTRSAKEYAVGHLENAILFDPENGNFDQFSSLPKGSKILLYCTVGVRSELVGEKLTEMGFSNIKNLHGGAVAWKNAGYRLVNIDGMPTDSLHVYSRPWGIWLKNGIAVYD